MGAHLSQTSHVCVHWLGIEVSDQAILVDVHVKEYYELSQPLSGKLDGGMKEVNFVKKYPQALNSMWLDGKYRISLNSSHGYY